MSVNSSYPIGLAMFMTFIRILFLVACATSAGAATPQNMQVVYQEAEKWLQQQAAQTWPGVEAQARSGTVDDRLRLPACRELQFSLPAGSRLGSSGSLAARCQAGARWSLYITYRMRLSGPALVAGQALPAGSLVNAANLEERTIDYESAPTAYVKAGPLPAGTYLTRAVEAGQPLLAAWLARHPVVTAGQRVRVVVEGAGFSVTQEGQALNAALAGATVRVKTTSGRIVHGTAQDDGSVRVRP